jgi:hypothetical protein
MTYFCGPMRRTGLAMMMLAWCVAGAHAFAPGSRPVSAQVRRRAISSRPATLFAMCVGDDGGSTSRFGVQEPQPDRGARLAREGPTMQTGGEKVDLDKGQFGGGSGGTAVLEDTDFSVNTILKQLESIQQGTPKNIVILGTRHCSFLHQQIIELLSYALVLSDNHIFTSGATGTHAAAIRGALRAENPELLTVILPQTVSKQPREIRELLGEVRQLIELGHDQLPLDAASRICNSELLSKGDQVCAHAHTGDGRPRARMMWCHSAGPPAISRPRCAAMLGLPPSTPRFDVCNLAII